MYSFNSKNALPTYYSIAGAPNYFLLFLFLDPRVKHTVEFGKAFTFEQGRVPMQKLVPRILVHLNILSR